MCIRDRSETVESTETRSKSKAEEFYSSSGKLIEKQFHDLGTVKGLEVQMLQVIDLGERTEVRALRFEMTYSTQYTSQSKIAVIDKDEVAGLIQALKLIQEKVIPTTRNTYTEVSFTSRSGFLVGSFFDVKKLQWRAYVRVDQYSSNSTVYMSTEELAQLLALVEQAHL